MESGQSKMSRQLERRRLINQMIALNFVFIQLTFTLTLILCTAHRAESLIITSVIAGDKKFKTISFDSKFLKPLTFEKELPNTEFRRHRTMRPPKFDIDVNIPIKLPLEEEYPQEEYRKPVESNIFFQTGEINEPTYGGKKQPNKNRPMVHSDEYASASNHQDQPSAELSPTNLVSEGLKGLLPTLAKSIKLQPKFEVVSQVQAAARRSNTGSEIKGARSNQPVAHQQFRQWQQTQAMRPQDRQSAPTELNQAASYSAPQSSYKEPDFVPGGFVNLQLSGPSGGPQMTYEDYDREKWAQQLSQTPGAMPYPILNYHQLQNFYGGLGTFTNGLAEHRYNEQSLMDKFKSSLTHLTSKFHIG